jgi:predicted alpha/beta superfamily hydrolase
MIHKAMKRVVAAAAALLVGCGLAADAVTPGAKAASRALPPVSFPNSAVHEVPSDSGRRYQVWVDLPASYAGSDKAYPVVFVTDPNFAFATTRTIRDFSGQRGRNIEEFILVGLVHDPDVAPMQSRGRDYTPTDPRKNPQVKPGRYTGDRYGEAGAYLAYVEEKVFPLIAANYRADMSRKTLVGHSYGSVFGLYTLFKRPGLFQNYVLGSPSLWFDDHLLLKIEADYARTHKDLPAKIHMVAGSYETLGPTPRHYEDNDLAGAMTRFASTLGGRGYPSLTVSSEVAEGEDHFTVFHDVASRGLLRVLPGKGPYTSG